MRLRTKLLLALVCALCAGLPILHKAFTIDDTPVLRVAEQISQNPLKPFDCRINWFADPQPIFEVTTNPPFLSYVLAPFYSIWGLNEPALHIPMLLFLILGAVAMVFLSQRFAGGSLWPLLLLISSPAVIVSVNLMRDVPAMALSMASIAAFIKGSDQRQAWLLALGASLGGLAMLTKYSMLTLFFVLGLYVLLERRPRDLRWLLIPAGMLGLWSLQNILVHGSTHLGFLGSHRFGENGFTLLEKFGGMLVILGSLVWLWPAALLFDGLRRRWARLLLWIISPIAVRLLFSTMPIPAADAPISLFMWGGAGLALLVWILLEFSSLLRESAPTGEAKGSPARRDLLFLFGWAGTSLITAVTGVSFQAVRHLLPALPALLLLATLFFQASRGGRTLRWALAGCVLSQIGLSGAIGLADAEFADAGRAFIRDELPRLRESGKEIWFCGNWGFRTYAEEAGLEDALFRPPMPPTGALLIRPLITHKSRFNPELEKRLKKWKEFPYPGRLPLRTMGPGAGFYATTPGKIPFRFSREPKEVFQIFEVGPPN